MVCKMHARSDSAHSAFQLSWEPQFGALLTACFAPWTSRGFFLCSTLAIGALIGTPFTHLAPHGPSEALGWPFKTAPGSLIRQTSHAFLAPWTSRGIQRGPWGAEGSLNSAHLSRTSCPTALSWPSRRLTGSSIRNTSYAHFVSWAPRAPQLALRDGAKEPGSGAPLTHSVPHGRPDTPS